MTAPLRVRGTPQALDSFLEPVVALTLGIVAVPAMVVLWWFEAWWWIPVPAVLAAGLHQWFFWSRGDRPTELVLEPHYLTLHDRSRGEPLALALDQVQVAMLYLRTTARGPRAVVMLADAAGPCFGVQLALPRLPTSESSAHAVDVDAADRHLGGQAGVLRAVTPIERAARQTFPRPGALTWLLERIPREAWARSGVRLWRGEAPALSPFGLHVAEPDAWLVLEGNRWRLQHPEGPTEQGELSPPTCTGFVRTVDLMVPSDEGPRAEPTSVGMVTLHLAPALVVSFPAPLLSPELESRAPRAEGFHCHAPEGAALVAHLQHVLGPALPGPLRACLDTSFHSGAGDDQAPF